MTTFLLILIVVIGMFLVLVAAMYPRRSEVSMYELTRRAKQGNPTDTLAWEYEQHREDMATVVSLLVTLLFVVFVLMSVAVLGWFWGAVVAIFGGLAYRALGSIAFVKTLALRLYTILEPHLFAMTVKLSPVMFVLRGSYEAPAPEALHSREEAVHLLQQSTGIFSANEKKMLLHTLSFGDKTVQSVMTPRAVVDTVNKKDLLGPLTLDTLYKTGHSRLPVMDGDIDHIVGVLHIQDLLKVSVDNTPTAEQAMEQRVYYIREDHTLDRALAAFLRTHHHLFVVINAYRETVGVMTLEDVMEALLGHKIIDEFDAHDNLRAVAARNPHGNNTPKVHTDI